MSEPDVSLKLGGIQMKNPVMTASGCYGYGRDYLDTVPLESWGALVVKGTTLFPREGNPPPRLVETPSGLINSVGLQNPGVEHFLREELPWLRNQEVPLIVNLAGDTEEEYLRLAEKLESEPAVNAIEINISCPNVKKGGCSFGSRTDTVGKLVSRLRSVYSRTMLVKLTPNVDGIPEIARAAQEAGADALSLINTIRAISIDVEKQKPVLAMETGGLSGPAVKPIALRILWEVAREVDIPLVGMGGITGSRDALEFILAGASAVSLGTGIFCNPRAHLEVVEGIREYLRSKGCLNLAEIVGAAH